MTSLRREEDFFLQFNRLQQRLEAVERLVLPTVLLTDKRLPENPFDGQIADVQIEEGINWRFRYNAGSSSSKKWEFQFGPPLYNEVTPSDNIASAAYVAFSPNPGPVLTVPLAGDYYVDIGARIISPVAGSDTFFSYTIGATAAVDDDGINSRQSDAASGHNIRSHYQRRRRKNDLTAGVVLTGQGKNSASSASIGTRWFSLQPIRVS